MATNFFPAGETIASAANRGEAILSLYGKAGIDAGSFRELVEMAIRDIAIFGWIESGVASQEAIAEGDYPPAGVCPEDVCEAAGEAAREMIEDARRESERAMCG